MSELLPRRPLGSVAAEALGVHLDALTVRVRAREVEAIAARIDPSDPVPGLRAVLEEAEAEAAKARDDLARLEAEALVTEPAGLPALVLAGLRADPTAGRREAAAARRGRLDLPCLLERLHARIEAPAVQLELACRLAPPLTAAAGADPTPLLAPLGRLAEAEPRRPTRLAAVVALARLQARLGVGADPGGDAVLERLLEDPQGDPWVRRAVLETVPDRADAAAEPWLVRGLQARGGPEDHLVRARAAELALERASRPLGGRLLALAQDDSELVRFTLADGLASRVAAGDDDAAAAVRALVVGPDPRLQARLAWALGSAGARGLALLAPLLGGPPAVARIALDAATEALLAGVEPPEALARAAGDAAYTAPPLARRLDLLRCLLDAAAAPLAALADELSRLPEGTRARVTLPADARVDDLARALVRHAAVGFGFDLAPRGPVDQPGIGVVVTRGDVPTPALWRLLDELRRPAPAKRQAHSHSPGRADRGPVRVPPLGLAEATPTGVAGQRVWTAAQDGWAPELPQVEDLLHATSHGEIRVHSPRGITRIRSPRGPRRLWARWRLRWSFRRYDQVRLAALDEVEPALAEPWRRALEKLGFEVEVPPAPATPSRAWIDPLSFALGMGGSTLGHLGIVVLVLAGLLFGRLSWAGHRLRRARAAVPLVLGGWGTRGKSGTERLKAGLVEALGLPFLSKTTGCEAMVLHAPPGGRARELFLYRPYDKATIWEQAEVTLLAPRMGARVLLWECMALNPAYVELLQGRWMHDDVSTLTNAFPDHEDIQGPTGQDVARVIAGFSPRGGRLLTTERIMLPILREVALERGTDVQALHPALAELLPRDLLARFRHREHPANVALVAALARGLGLHEVEAVGFMAERVVADVGALVVHPPVDTEGRRITFAQGMSANDPLSFRHSWKEAGFLEACPPEEWRVSVVNNRADRIARSRMFAGLLAEDAAAHAHVLIGTNLSGLRAYVAEAVSELLARLDLARPEVGERLAAHLRLGPAGPPGAAVAVRLGAPAEAASAWAEAVAALPTAAPDWGSCQALARDWAGRPARRLAEALPPAARRYAGELETHLVRLVARDLARQALLQAGPTERGRLFAELVDAALVTVPSPTTPGDRIIATVLAQAPPGAHVRLIGLQNIKGTGLDFAYRWVEWGQLHPRLDALRTAAGEERRRLLAELATRSYGSVMAIDGAWSALARIEGDDPDLRAARQALQARREALLALRRAGGKGQAHGLLGRIRAVVERALDPLDGIWRRARGRAILAELAAGRISHDRAQVELAALVTRQKGGWL